MGVKSMNKQLILPVIALFALIIKQTYGIELSDEILNQVTDGILALSILVGIFMNPKKGK